MATRRSTTRKGGSGTCPLGEDPSTIRNPYARPKAGSVSQATKRPLPEVVWLPDAGVRFALQRGDDPPGMDVIGGSVWQLLYRCIYPHGVRDEIARFQRVIAGSREEAIRVLQGRMFGFAERIELYEVLNLKRQGAADGK